MTRFCASHPAAKAGWICSVCERTLCPDCAALKTSGHTELTVCGKCGELADVLKVHRKEIPYSIRVRKAPLYPLTADGALAMGLTGLVTTVLSYHPLSGLMMIGALWAYVFSLIRASSMGQDGFTPPDFQTVIGDVLAPALKFLLATTLFWGTAVVYAIWFREEPTPFYTDPVFLVLIAAGILYTPMALLIAGSGAPVLTMLNPVAVVAYISRLGTDYWIAVGALFVMLIVDIILTVIGRGIALLLPIPFFPMVVAAAMGTYAPFVMARILGLLLYTRGDDVGYGVASEYFVPVLPGAVPLAAPPLPKETTAVQVSRGVDVGRADLPAFVDEGPRTPALAEYAAEQSALALIGAAIARNELPAALESYRAATDFEVDGLTPGQHLTLGQAAATSADYPLAVRALSAAASGDKADPDVARALVILGRVYGERLGDEGAAREAFSRVVREFPTSKAAEFARTRLG